MLMRYQNDWHRILEFHHVSPGNTRAFIRIKLKQLRTGEEREIRLRAGEEVELLSGEHRPCDYLYQDGQNFLFLNPATYEEVAFPPERFGQAGRLLKPGVVVEGILAGDELVSVDLPNSFDLTVTDTSDTLSGEYTGRGRKMAIVETGVRVEAPLFVEPGDVIRINTRTGAYIERVQPA
jgi:elongation factor P